MKRVPVGPSRCAGKVEQGVTSVTTVLSSDGHVNFKVMMTKKSDISRIETKADLQVEDFEYRYNPQLTHQLDMFNGDFDRNIINTIALWKVNRYPYLNETARR